VFSYSDFYGGLLSLRFAAIRLKYGFMLAAVDMGGAMSLSARPDADANADPDDSRQAVDTQYCVIEITLGAKPKSMFYLHPPLCSNRPMPASWIVTSTRMRCVAVRNSASAPGAAGDGTSARVDGWAQCHRAAGHGAAGGATFTFLGTPMNDSLTFAKKKTEPRLVNLAQHAIGTCPTSYGIMEHGLNGRGYLFTKLVLGMDGVVLFGADLQYIDIAMAPPPRAPGEF